MSVEVSALEVHNNSAVGGNVLDRVKRKRRVAIGTLEARISGWGMDDERKAHGAVERDGAIEIGNRERNLIQVHIDLCLQPGV